VVPSVTCAAPCGVLLAAHRDHIDDRRRARSIDRRRPAAHHFDAIGHQVEGIHAVALVEEEAVQLVVERQPIGLIIEIAAISWDAAYAGDVLNLAPGLLDMNAG